MKEEGRSDWQTMPFFKLEGDIHSPFKLRTYNKEFMLYLGARLMTSGESEILLKNYDEAHSNSDSVTNWTIEGNIEGVFKLRTWNYIEPPIYLDYDLENHVKGSSYEEAHSAENKGSDWILDPPLY